jgi:hypothetical protein
MRRRAAALIALAALVTARGALASPSYPAALEADLGLAAAPRCDLCHHAAAAPVGPTDTPFGKSMVARGLVGNDDTASLAHALVRMRADGVDSDGDGAKDLDELSWGGDPNHASLPVGGAEMPVIYGCAWSGKAGESLPPGAAVGVLLGVAASRRQRRRRR